MSLLGPRHSAGRSSQLYLLELGRLHQLPALVSGAKYAVAHESEVKSAHARVRAFRQVLNRPLSNALSRRLEGAVSARVYFCYGAVLSLSDWPELQRHARYERLQVSLGTLLWTGVFDLNWRRLAFLLDALIPALRRLRGGCNGLRAVLVALVATLGALGNAEAEAAGETAEAERARSVRRGGVTKFLFRPCYIITR